MEQQITPILFSGTSHRGLAETIAQKMRSRLGRVKLSAFPDGEIQVLVDEDVSGKHVAILQSVALRPNHFLMELLLMVDALKRAQAKAITTVIPYFGYCRQDRINEPGEPISAKLVALLLEKAGTDKVISVDLHSAQIEGFFEIPFTHLSARSLLADQCKIQGLSPLTVVAPDLGSVKTAQKMAALLKADFAVINKKRYDATTLEMQLMGNVAGRHVLIVDDMCSTGKTLVKSAALCKEKGALRIFACVTHALFTDGSVEAIEQSPIEVCFITDSIPANERLTNSSKIVTISISSLLANALAL